MIARQDMAWAEGLMPWRAPQEFPLVFALGGRTVRGIPADWAPEKEFRLLDACIEETVFTGRSPEGLEVRAECRRYRDFPCVELFATLTNRGGADTPLIEGLALAGTVEGGRASLYHGNGDTQREDGYAWETTPLDGPLTVEPDGDGTPCKGAFPYMRLIFAEHCVDLAVGWAGRWTARFEQAPEGLSVRVAQKRCHMVIRPGETMRTPRLTLLASDGDEERSRNVWRRWYFAHVLPRRNGRPLGPICCALTFEAEGMAEHTGASEKNQLEAIDGYLARGFRPDLWWIDAGWYPCGGDWPTTGTWRADETRFPRGLAPVGEKCRENGMDFLLWFEPERVRPDTELAREHPEWLLCHHGENGEPELNRLLDLSDPACCDALIELVDRRIREYGVTVYRQDFNMPPMPFWIENEAPDRVGAKENLHVQGYLRFWDTLRERHPDLLIDSCSSGGRRNELDAMRRAIPLHYTDVGYGNHPIRFLQCRQMFEWIPYFRVMNMDWLNDDGTYGRERRKADAYDYYTAMTPSLTDMTPFDADGEAAALALRMQAIWRRAAALTLGTDFYPLTGCRKSAGDLWAVQFHDPASGRGFLNLANGVAAEESTFVLCLRGLEPEKRYRLTSAETGAVREETGAALAAGQTYVQPPHTGDVWFYEELR